VPQRLQKGAWLGVGVVVALSDFDDENDSDGELLPLDVGAFDGVVLGASGLLTKHSKKPAGQSNVPAAYVVHTFPALRQGPPVPATHGGHRHASVPLGHVASTLYAKQEPSEPWHGPEPDVHRTQVGGVKDCRLLGGFNPSELALKHSSKPQTNAKRLPRAIIEGAKGCETLVGCILWRAMCLVAFWQAQHRIALKFSS
jgi:hypothetical protein